jgi:hypothetical protein
MKTVFVRTVYAPNVRPDDKHVYCFEQDMSEDDFLDIAHILNQIRQWKTEYGEDSRYLVELIEQYDMIEISPMGNQKNAKILTNKYVLYNAQIEKKMVD